MSQRHKQIMLRTTCQKNIKFSLLLMCSWIFFPLLVHAACKNRTMLHFLINVSVNKKAESKASFLPVFTSLPGMTCTAFFLVYKFMCWQIIVAPNKMNCHPPIVFKNKAIIRIRFVLNLVWVLVFWTWYWGQNISLLHQLQGPFQSNLGIVFAHF